MADIVRGQNPSAAWEAYVPQDPVDNIFQRHYLLEMMRANGSFEKENGTVIRCNLEYATNPNVKWISEMETLTVFRPDTFDNAEYTWKNIGGDVPMTDLERAITGGSAKKYDLEAKKLDNLKNTMEERVNTAFFGDGTGTGGKEVGGLQLLASTTPTTGTVGLINRGTFTFFRNQATTSAGSAFSLLLGSLTSSYNSCSNGPGQENPTMVVATQTVFEGYEAKITTNERLVRDSPANKGISGYKGQNLMFKDIPIGYDNACLAGCAYMLNNRNLKFIHAQWMKGEPAVRPADGFWDVFKVLTIGNLITDNPRRLGVISGIT